MNIVIMGAGAVGSCLGAILAGAGNNVWFVARGPHLAAMKDNGLHVVGTRDMHINPVNATDAPSVIESCGRHTAHRQAMVGRRGV